MTTYNTYQEAKIANPSEDIYPHGERFTTIGRALITGTKCNPADHCMTVEKFLADGHKFVDGDLILNLNGNMNEIRGNEGLILSSEGVADFNCDRFILRAAALEKIPTETPEEKEVLDSIDSVGEVEWKNGDDVDAYGKPYKYVGLDPFNENLCICLANKYDDPQCFSVGILKKPETPQQRKDRERACAIYDMCAEADIFTEESNFWAGKFYDLGYKKEKTHGTN